MPNVGLRILFPVALVGAITLRVRLGLDWVETIQAIILCLPLRWLAGRLLYFMSAFLPAFDESAAALVIVAVMVGIGAFTVFGEDGTLARAYHDGHKGANITSLARAQ